MTRIKEPRLNEPRTNEHGQPVGDEVPGWAGRQPPAPVTLEGRHVVLEALSADHAQSLFDELCGPDDRPLWTYLKAEPPPDVAAMAREVAASTSDVGSLTLAVVRDGTALGRASYLRIDPGNGSIEIGNIILGRSLQRTPAATEALHLLARHAFDHLGYRRLEWKCDSLNEPSRAAAYRLGFAYEGRFRNALVVQGRNRDTDWFSITDAEWPQIRAAHEQWLDPSNFDDSGQQRVPLSVLTAAVRAELGS